MPSDPESLNAAHNRLASMAGTRRPKGGRWQTVGLVDTKGRRCVLPAATNGLALGWGEKRKDVDPSGQWRTWASLVNGGRVLANGSDM